MVKTRINAKIINRKSKNINLIYGGKLNERKYTIIK